MATDVMLMRAPGGIIIAADEQSKQVLAKWPLGQGIRAKVSRARSLVFHRRFFAMLNLGFEAWEPHPIEYLGEVVAKNFERFRKDVTVLAGYYDTTVNLKGEVRLEAKSISFDNMDQDEFERVYSRVADVILERILTRYTRDDLDNVVNQMLDFV